MSGTTVAIGSAPWTDPLVVGNTQSVVAILSMLHEPIVGSAVRPFRDRPVLRWTLDRLGACRALSAIAVLCWDDQAEVARAVAGADALIIVKGPRNPPAALHAVTAARRWADGWRGGLLGTCAFDAGFFGPWVYEAAMTARADAVLLIDPAAALLDTTLIAGLIEHATAHKDPEIFFLPAAPGLGAAFLRQSLLAAWQPLRDSGAIRGDCCITIRPS